MATPIDPAESLLAAIGVRPIISHRIERITPEQWNEAQNPEPTIQRAARAMVANELDHLTVNDFDRIDYSQTLRDLTQPYQPPQVAAMLMHIPLELDGLHASFIALAQKAFAFLYSQLPIVLRKSVAGNNNVVPPRRLISKFESLLWVLDNPIGVFNLIQNASLTSQQVEGMNAIYPTLCRHMRDDAIPDATEDARVNNSKFQLSRHAEQGVRRFLGRHNLPPALGQILQAKPNQQQPGAQAPAGMPTPRQQPPRHQPPAMQQNAQERATS